VPSYTPYFHETFPSTAKQLWELEYKRQHHLKFHINGSHETVPPFQGPQIPTASFPSLCSLDATLCSLCSLCLMLVGLAGVYAKKEATFISPKKRQWSEKEVE
jgi:hypothetical protein